jgi:HD-like signal output (HDOD) protein
MITQEEIDNFINKIPPTPEVLKKTISLLNQGELLKAATVAKEDKALNNYLKNIVNKPIYGFINEVNDTSQIFGILGVAKSKQSVYNYMLTLLNPNKWVLFSLNINLFYKLQTNLTTKYSKILEHLHVEDKEIYEAISLLPASIIVTEALFSKHIDDVKLLRETKALDYNTILKRLTGMSIFDLCEVIANKWEMDPKVSQIIQAASGTKPSKDNEVNKIAKWMHLLFFYELSQEDFVKAGLNDFIDFQIDFVSDVYDDFSILMEIG